jgi:hypothetical protein
VGKSEDLLHGSSDTQRLIKPQPSFQNDKGYALLGSAEAFGRIAIGVRQELLSLHETMTDALLAGKLTEALEASAACMRIIGSSCGTYWARVSRPPTPA